MFLKFTAQFCCYRVWTWNKADFIYVFDAIECFKEKGSPWNLSDGNRNKELDMVPGCDTGVLTVFIHIFYTGISKATDVAHCQITEPFIVS